MKPLLLGSALLVAFALRASAQSTFTYSGPAYAIPDGNAVGVFSTLDVTGAGNVLADITVSLDIDGGYNGDLYGYLSYDGHLVTLLNRVGVGTGNPFGSPGSGFEVTLGSSGSDIHAQSGTGGVSGNFRADGRGIDPLGPPASFDPLGTENLNAVFGGLNPNGQWTLFLADLSGGGGTASLQSWSLGISVIPEPAGVGMLSGIGMVTWLALRTGIARIRARTASKE